MSEPLELATITQRTTEARQAFARDVDALLDGLTGFLDDADHLDAASVRATLQAMRQQVRETFDHPPPSRSTRVDPLGLQELLREAYDLLTNPETAIDLRDWIRAATPFVRSS